MQRKEGMESILNHTFLIQQQHQLVNQNKTIKTEQKENKSDLSFLSSFQHNLNKTDESLSKIKETGLQDSQENESVT